MGAQSSTQWIKYGNNLFFSVWKGGGGCQQSFSVNTSFQRLFYLKKIINNSILCSFPLTSLPLSSLTLSLWNKRSFHWRGSNQLWLVFLQLQISCLQNFSQWQESERLQSQSSFLGEKIAQLLRGMGALHMPLSEIYPRSLSVVNMPVSIFAKTLNYAKGHIFTKFRENRRKPIPFSRKF